MKTEKPIRLGIFGLGRGSSYYDLILKNNVEIVAVCSKRQNELDAAAKKLGKDVGLYDNFDDFIRHDMDAVFLANYFHEHAPYAIRCLNNGLHVLSECASNETMAEGVALARAAKEAEKKGVYYMLAENYPYMKFNQEMHRVYRGGTLGKVLFGEGEYNHPFAPTDTDFIQWSRPYDKHWRNYLPRSYYITHSLAPLMYITGSVPRKVTAFPCYAPLEEAYPNGNYVGDRAAIITCLNDDDSVFRVTGCAAFGAHGNAYRICGTEGMIENVRGTDGKVMLQYNEWSKPEGSQTKQLYDPQWPAESAQAVGAAGHDGGDYFVMREFFAAIREGRRPVFDVYFATAMASVAILAHRSILAGGQPLDVPDFRCEEDFKAYENDTASPFYHLDGREPTLPCCSRPDFRPSDDQIRRYRELIK